MSIFDEATIRRYPSPSYVEIDELMGEADGLMEGTLLRESISPVSGTPMKAAVLLQSSLRRVSELSRSFAASLNADLYVPLFVLSRALLETAYLVWDLSERIDRVLEIESRDSVAELDLHLDKVVLGSRSDSWTDGRAEYQPPNILTIIDRLCRSDRPQIREHYDVLSEFAHPNYTGMLEAYSEPDDEAGGIRFIEAPIRVFSDRLTFPITGVVAALVSRNRSTLTVSVWFGIMSHGQSHESPHGAGARC